MVLTDNEELAELARSLRTFGWIRDSLNGDKMAEKYKNIDPRYLFINTGYNFRPTEIQGAFGIHQLGKLEDFIKVRTENAEFWNRNLKDYQDYLLLPIEREQTRRVWFNYPFTIKHGAPFTRKEFSDFLESKGVETRPVMAGNIDEQPAMALFKYRKSGELKNSSDIMHNTFLIGNHQGIGKIERAAVLAYVKEFLSMKTKG
jgi:CDP-4-dehydro-6-deoxyglucose reductase, E1